MNEAHIHVLANEYNRPIITFHKPARDHRVHVSLYEPGWDAQLRLNRGQTARAMEKNVVCIELSAHHFSALLPVTASPTRTERNTAKRGSGGECKAKAIKLE